MDQDTTGYGVRPQARWHCVRWGPSSPHGKGLSYPLLFGLFCSGMVAGRPSQQLLSSWLRYGSRQADIQTSSVILLTLAGNNCYLVYRRKSCGRKCSGLSTHTSIALLFSNSYWTIVVLNIMSRTLVMAALWNRAGHYIFALWFLSFFYLSFFFSSPNLRGRRLDVYHTSTHGVALVWI